MNQENKMYKVAVYGSLRKGMHNDGFLKNAEYLGVFETSPSYNLYSLGSYPGLTKGGNTPVTMEVYEVTQSELMSINRLEGYDPSSEDNTFYDRINLRTPFGTAFTYVYEGDVSNYTPLEVGDWVSYRESLISKPIETE